MTPIEFLTARLDEREEVYEVPKFNEADSARGPGWGNRGDCQICGAYQFDGTEAATEEGYIEHLERAHQLTWALADLAAKRAILEEHPDGDGYCGQGDYSGTVGCGWLWPCITLRLLVQPYADHPDGDPAWRVS